MAENEEVGSPGVGGGKKKLIVILLVLILVLGGAAAGAWFFLKGPSEEEGEVQQEETAQIEKGVEKTPFLENPLYSEPYEQTVRLADGKRFLKVNLRLGFVNEAIGSFLVSREPIIKDLILRTLQKKRTEDLVGDDGVNQLKQNLKTKINSIFTEEFINAQDTKDRQPIKDVLFEEFIQQ